MFLFTRAAFEPMSLDERCPVCEEIPTRFKDLSCGHHLCENCVQFLLPVSGDSLHCPTCSRHTRIVTTSGTGRHSQPRQSQAGKSTSICMHISIIIFYILRPNFNKKNLNLPGCAMNTLANFFFRSFDCLSHIFYASSSFLDFLHQF